ncbi:hypothetical protein QFZ88_001520 [Mesorhizobium sp. YL-MeA3-2017]|nr:hypothetical protein [Mesorhizobium sp. YL-MeA3-2017]
MSAWDKFNWMRGGRLNSSVRHSGLEAVIPLPRLAAVTRQHAA